VTALLLSGLFVGWAQASATGGLSVAWARAIPAWSHLGHRRI